MYGMLDLLTPFGEPQQTAAAAEALVVSESEFMMIPAAPLRNSDLL